LQRRVVITGLGVVAPNGIGKEDFWSACVSGRSGIRRITRFDASQLPTRIAGEVPDFEPEAFGISQKEALHTDRSTQFALAAASLAIQDAKLLDDLSEAERDRMGVYVGSAMATVAEGDQLLPLLKDDDAHSIEYEMYGNASAKLLLTHASAAAIAIHYQLRGPSMAIATGCSAGADAIGEAFWAIQDGYADCMIAGGADSAISYGGLAAFNILGALSTRNDEPERASRPYDQQRDGFVMAEGAGILVLEERERALARNAHIYAELITFVSNINSHHMTALPPDGAPLQQLLRQALDEARITPAQLGYINSHSSSTPINEIAETAAYKAVFGEQAYHIPISSTKSMIGHTQGAASAIETVVTALVLERQVIPPTINQQFPDPLCDLDYVPNIARQATVEVALTHSSGFGGVNNLLVLSQDSWRDKQSSIGNVMRTGSAHQRKRRVVITGLGVVAANGIGKEAFWRSTSRGISGIKPLQRYPVSHLPIRVGGEVSDFAAQDYIERKLIKRTDRTTHFVFAAVQEALREANIVLEQENPQRVGAVIANTLGGIEFAMEQLQPLFERGPRYISVYSAIAWLQVANVGQISIRHGFQGYCKTPVNDTVGGLNALGIAFRSIQRGAADVIITGACEAPLHPMILSLLARDGYAPNGENPNAYRPFDRRAAGLLLAEGAGICILEEYEHARARGVPIYGEIVGYGHTNDAHGFLNPSSNGSQYARAIQHAMQERNLSLEDIAYFSLDGRAIPSSDRGEAEALRMVFGTGLQRLPVSVPRTMFGHSYAAAGPLDAITALLALRYGMIPPTINCEQLDPRYGLNLVQEEARPVSGNAVLIGGRGVGGMNVVVAIRKV
jgi:beta-ketoacyl-acyl-carrier-protein synthase II